MFKTNVYKEAFSHMLTNKMTTEDYSILNLANEAYPAMPSVDSKLDDTLAKYNAVLVTKSLRWFAIFSCKTATCRLDFILFLEPFSFLDNLRCNLDKCFSFFL